MHAGLAEVFPGSGMGAVRIGAAVAVGAAALGVGIWQWVRTHRITPEQRERMRRQRLSQIGRICDGTVLDVQETAVNGRGPNQLLVYTYDVGGVTYEASQDISALRELIDIHRCKLGLPSSVRYDPHNPGNSIVVSEQWMGLRQ